MRTRGGRVVALLLVGLLIAPASPAASGDLDPRLQAAVDLYRQEGAETALPEFQRLAKEFAKHGPARQHAAALHYVGESYWRLGQFDEARQSLDRALAIERKAGDGLGEARTLNVLGLLEWDLGDYEQAIRRFRSAGAMARDQGDRRLEGASLNNLGLVQDELGNYDASLASYRKALELYRGEDFQRGVGDTLGNIGGVHLLLGRFRDALGYYRQALAISEQLQSKPSMSQDHGNIGLCLLGLGEAGEALVQIDEAIALATQAGMQQDSAFWTLHRGNALVQQGRYDEGLAAHRAALVTYEQIDAKAELARALHDAGRLYLQLGDMQSAERDFARALELAQSIGFARGVTENMLALGDLAYRRGQLAAAAGEYARVRERAAQSGQRQVLAESLLRLALVHREQGQLDPAAEEASRALGIAREANARTVEAEALLAVAEIDRRRGQTTAALQIYSDARTAATRVGDPNLLWQIHYGRGLALEAKRDVPGAIDALLEAVTVIEGVRNRLQEPRFRAGYVEDKYDVYLDLVRLQLQVGRTIDAFTTAERLRTRHFAEQLGDRSPAAITDEDRRKDAALRARVRQLQRAISDEESVEQPVTRQHVTDRLFEELVAAEREYQAFLDDRRPGIAPGAGAMPALTAASVQRRLATDEALLEYLVGPQQLTIFVVTARGLTATGIPVPRNELRSRIALLRDLVRQPGDDRWMKPAASLSSLLVDALEADGQLKGIERLYLVPHGALNQLPFALLAAERRSRDRLLVDRYSIAYLPTASALLAEQPPSVGPRSALAVAPARSRLRHAPEEARAVHAMYKPNARLLLGASATESQFKKVAGGYRVLHLATHGDFNSVNPLLSGLELEADGSDDGLLQLHEILGLRLDADIVTLSACETGLASGHFADTPAGDELLGLTRAFLAAGSTSVMATLWEVDDLASVKLMKSFYERLNESREPGNAVLALARTQRELRATKTMAHPYFWAPFIVAGTPRPAAIHAAQSNWRQQ